jgi:glycosyltransferase involved in cell wall biosynthesis
MKVSVLILTLNEENNLPNSFESLKWCDDVVVLDSHSTDNTASIVKKFDARIFFRKFDDYASQRNYGLNEIDFKYKWVLMVDADEIVAPELVFEINALPESVEPEICIYRMRRKDYFLGRWIKHSSCYPVWFGRLVRLGRIRVERSINEEYHTDGQIGYLQNHLIHYPFNKGFYSWIEKHNRYSTMEAALMVEKSNRWPDWKEIFYSDPAKRRKAIKQLVYLLPGRPLLIFCVFYFLKCGFLDGKPGLKYCTLKAFYEYMIDCKVKELKRKKKNLPI